MRSSSSKVKNAHFYTFLSFYLAVFSSLYVLSWLLSSLVVPIGISLFFAFVLAPVVKLSEKVKIPRSIFTFILVLFLILIVTLLSLRTIPFIYYETIGLLRLAPAAMDAFNQIWLPYVKDIVVNSGLVSEQQFLNLLEDFSGVSNVSTEAYNALATIWRGLPQILGTLINLILVPLLTFFLILYTENLKTQFQQLIPRTILPESLVLFKQMSETINKVIKGQCLVAGILAVLYVIGFSIIGLPSAFVIGFVAGICRIIPYLDIFVGGFLCLIVTLTNFVGWSPIVSFVFVILIVQTLDGTIITPKIIGQKAGLHPIIVIVGVLGFGGTFGFWGVLFAVPSLALFKDLFVLALPRYLGSKVYKG